MKKTLLLLNIFLFSIGVNIALAQVPAYVPTNGLVGWWPFNGNANDESGNGNHGTVNGATLTTDRFGNANKAYFFPGNVANKIVIPNSNDFNFTDGFSISVWAYFQQSWVYHNESIIYKGTTNGWQICVDQNDGGYGVGNYLASCQFTSSGASDYCCLPFQEINLWRNYTLVFDGINLKIYVDGVLRNSSIQNSSSVNNLNNIEIGGSANPVSGAYNRSIDDIAIYNRALTQQEITNLYTNSVPPTCSITPTSATVCAGDSVTLTASTSTTDVSICSGSELPGTLQNGLVGYWPFCGNANDASGNGNNGTVNGATLTTDRFGNANSAYSFDGVDDYVNAGNNTIFNLGDFTISLWYYEASIVGASSHTMLSKSTSYNNEIGYRMEISPDGMEYFVLSQIGIIQPGTGNIVNSNAIINSWTNIIVKRYGGVVELYKNGIQVGVNSSLYAQITNNSNLLFGAVTYQNMIMNFFNGKLDDIAIWNRALTPSEIQQLYTQGQTTYSWSNGATTPSITVAPATTTTYTCTATVNGASGSSTSTVTVNPLPAVNAGADVAICSGNTATLAASGAATYSWNNSVSNGVAFSPAASNTYTVTGTDANGCVNTDTVVVTVNPLPTVNAGSGQTVCAGTSVILSASGATTYSWNNGVSNGVAFSPAASGTYSVSGTDANGCVNSDDVVVTVNTLPTVNAGSDQSVCAGTSVTLSASGANTYAWDNNVSNGTAFTPAATNTYAVSGTDANGCSNTDQVIVTVNPMPNINAGADQSICKGDAVTLSGTGASTYAWNNNVTNGVAFNPMATATYSVAGTDANGCINADEVVVTVNEATASTLTESALDSYTLNGQTYTQSGTYTQVLTNAAGCDSTITLNLTLSFTGLNELAQGIQLFPNPANDVLNIQSSAALAGEYTLYDAAGRAVLRGTFTGALTKIDVRNIAPGTYTLLAAELMERIVVLRK